MRIEESLSLKDIYTIVLNVWPSSDILKCIRKKKKKNTYESEHIIINVVYIKLYIESCCNVNTHTYNAQDCELAKA